MVRAVRGGLAAREKREICLIKESVVEGLETRKAPRREAITFRNEA